MSNITEQQQQSSVLEGPELQSAIRRQVEYYLSHQNLQRDVYLVSQMDDQQSVPVSLLTSFKLLRQLTTDVDLVCRAVHGSDLVTVVRTDADGPRIKPASIQQMVRDTVILRNIPRETDEKIVLALFHVDNVPLSLRPEIGSTWWATFATEQGAVSALKHLRTQHLPNDAPIRAYIKAETFLKSDTRTKSAAEAEFIPSAATAPQQNHHNEGTNGNYYYPYYHNGTWDPYNSSYVMPMDRHHTQTSGFRGGRGGGRRNGRRGGTRGAFDTLNGSTGKQRHQNGVVADLTPPQSSTSKTGKQHRYQGQQRPSEVASSSNSNPARSDIDSIASKNYHENSASKIRAATAGINNKNHHHNNENKRARSNARQQNLPNFSTSSFPPLPRVPPAAKTSGYDGEFIRYDKQSIIDVHNSIIGGSNSNITMSLCPETMTLDVAGVVSDPNLQLELTKTPLSDNTVVSPTGPMQRKAMEAMFVEATKAAAISTSETAPAKPTAANVNIVVTDRPSFSAAAAASAPSSSKSFVEVALHAKDIHPPRRSSFSVGKKTRSRAASRIDNSMKPSAELLAKARSKFTATEDQKPNVEAAKDSISGQKDGMTKPHGQTLAKDDEMKVVVRRKRYTGRQKGSGNRDHKEQNINNKDTTRRRRKESNENDGADAPAAAATRTPSADEKSYASIVSKIKAAAKANQEQREVQPQQVQGQQ